ncbi:NAD(P)-dependent alcohol dehydrogenase [Cellulomonas marina]|uniref:NADPH:quinone reductase n=1 Tax=Cellulomonas marina TaxID=988821 RepID=A0A1I0X7U2_9CELL|nr:NAD(P)-dependent alcohol dehydrogenase [Cellulomonas marina]GIG29490.1 NADPH:quinone reductase [Cellulomonas marina]SFA96934.1 NADPH:quinone reductase [Cellulomonas marina]
MDVVAVPTRMEAVVQRRYGGPEGFRVEEVPTPVPRAGEVLVEVHAAGVDRGVAHLVAGDPAVVRLVTGLRSPRQPVPGMDLAGRVVALGPGVTDLAVGDEVLGTGRGSFAPYARARVDRLVRRPAGLDVVAAAALPVSGLTAQGAVDDVAAVRAGHRVLVLGASGGVGTYAVQLAVAAGAEVTGVCSAGKADLVRALGAHRVLDHAREDATAGDERYDAVVDIGGRTPVRRLRRVLTPAGTLVLVGGEGGGRLTGGLGRQLAAAATSPFVRQRLVMLVATERREALGRLVARVVAGDVAPAVGRTYPLAAAAEAVADLVAGRTRGKSVLVVREG